jgi:hypothetical protein
MVKNKKNQITRKRKIKRKNKNEKNGKKKSRVQCASNTLNHLDIDFFSITCRIYTHLLKCLHYPHTHSSHVYKLTIFAIVEPFFFYINPTFKTLCNLTSSCSFKASPSPHTKKSKKRKHRKRRNNTNGEEENKRLREKNGE